MMLGKIRIKRYNFPTKVFISSKTRWIFGIYSAYLLTKEFLKLIKGGVPSLSQSHKISAELQSLNPPPFFCRTL